jgi:phosphate transport system permease protein
MKTAETPVAESAVVDDLDAPRRAPDGFTTSDRVFHATSRTIGASVLVIMGSIGLFLGWQSIPTFRHYGLSFLTESQWQPQRDTLGISAVLIGTVTVALVAIIVAFPLALSAALFITEIAPPRLRSILVSAVDLMAAVPSIVFGLWGFLLLEPHALHIAHWLSTHLGFLPFFHVTQADNGSAVWPETRYTASAFIAGLAVAMMIIPSAAAIMREVFDRAPIAEREAAMALGSTKWGVIRTVVLPFGRGGIIGGTMLSLGRALGETIAVVLIISVAFDVKFRPLEIGTSTVSSLIAGRFGEASSAQLSALLTAGFVLFVITLFVNTIAARIVTRGRSATATEI